MEANTRKPSQTKKKKITIVKLTHAKACSFQRVSLRDCTQYKIWGICQSLHLVLHFSHEKLVETSTYSNDSYIFGYFLAGILLGRHKHHLKSIFFFFYMRPPAGSTSKTHTGSCTPTTIMEGMYYHSTKCQNSADKTKVVLTVQK